MATNKRLIKSNDEGGGVAASFNTVTWTGVSNASRDFTGVGFQPDLVWAKTRTTYSFAHILFDSVRGPGKSLHTNNTGAEVTNGGSGYIDSFDLDGFSTLAGSPYGNEYFDKPSTDFVAWCWKAGGAAVTNTDGTITSQVSANTEAGFSIVKYTGNGANGTVGHGLGLTPNIVLTKRRDSTSNWSFNGNIGGLIYGTNKLALHDTAGIVVDTNEVLAANSNNFTAGTSGAVGASGGTYIAYCFAEVEGFSNFGSYVGTDTRQGIVTGFEPAFVMIKRTNAANSWFMIDNKRFTTNQYDRYLLADSSGAEGGLGSTQYVSFLENGFSVETGSGLNASGGSYIYMAFANQF